MNYANRGPGVTVLTFKPSSKDHDTRRTFRDSSCATVCSDILIYDFLNSLERNLIVSFS